METMRYEIARDLPLLHQADVIVVGGGPGGLGAAVVAARTGAEVLLIERYGVLGGMAVSGEVHPFMPNHVDQEPLDGPVYGEWVEKMRQYWPREGKERDISKDVAALAAEDLCLEAGVEILYHHHLADVVVVDGNIAGLVLFSKSGLTAARAAVYVDCTGDADLAARAGCEFELGGPSGHCQPMTLCFKLSQVDRERMPDRQQINRPCRSTGYSCPGRAILIRGTAAAGRNSRVPQGALQGDGCRPYCGRMIPNMRLAPGHSVDRQVVQIRGRRIISPLLP